MSGCRTPTDKKMIQQGFDTVAPGYDHPSLCFFPETAKRLIEHLELDALDQNPGLHLLDVCTGTGCVALAAAERLSQGHITGIDLSTGMLQQAINKAAAKNLNNTQFHQMDLEHLSLENLDRPDQAFDIATSSFGLFFLEDMVKGPEQHRQYGKTRRQNRHHQFCRRSLFTHG